NDDVDEHGSSVGRERAVVTERCGSLLRVTDADHAGAHQNQENGDAGSGHMDAYSAIRRIVERETCSPPWLTTARSSYVPAASRPSGRRPTCGIRLADAGAASGIGS